MLTNEVLRTQIIYRNDREEGDDDDDEDEDEVYCDIDNDPNVIRKVYELEGQDMDEDDEASQAGDGDDGPGSGLALKPTGWSDGREEEAVRIKSVPK